MSYRELNARANQLARYLQRLGVGPEVCVAVCLERSLHLIVALLGVLKAGGAYLPLDPSYPPERLGFMLDDAQVRVLLTATTADRQPTEDRGLKIEDSRLVARNPLSSILNPLSSTRRVVDLAADWPTIAQQPDTDHIGSADPDNLAYVIYTSGSTGTPKGTMVHQRGLVNFTLAMVERIGLQPTQRFLQFAPFSFDASVVQVFPTLISGATLVLHPNPARLSNHEVLEVCARQQITVLDLPASFWQQWVEDLAARGASLPASVCVCMTGGERIPLERLRTWAGLATRPTRFLSSYGPTETTVGTTTFITTSDQVDRLTAPNVPLGDRLANIQLYLLDAHLQPVPIGVLGELYIGGTGLARGYLRRPDLTAERFVPNPFAEQEQRTKNKEQTNENQEPGTKNQEPRTDDEPVTQNSKLTTHNSRLYKTGDLARYLSDSTLEFLGRIDQQVKLRGFRVEVGEVEAALHQHPAVREAVALLREDLPGEKQLVAYIVPTIEDRGLKIEDSTAGLSETLSSILYPLSSELRSFLKEKLPDYMVPGAFVLLEALPLTRNGKIDRRALPAPDRTAQRSESYVQPRDTVELQLARMWEDLLAVRPIGVTDNFFDLGGHSLLALSLMAHIQQQFGLDLPLATLFQESTVEQLAARLRQRADPIHWSPLVPIQRGGTKPPIFCVHPAGGNVLCYAALSRHLGPDQPLYGLQARGLEEGQEPYTRIEDMAACYVAALKGVQPQGPYYLGGWSAGGVVAFEMAQQMHRQGHEVALLAILDTGAPQPGAPPDSPSDAEVIVELIGKKNLPMAEEEFQRLTLDEQVDCLLELARKFNVLPLDIGPAQVHRMLGVFRASGQAADSYVPQVYPGQIALFKAEAVDEDGRLSDAAGEGLVPDPTMGWSDLSTWPVEVYPVAGTHITMVTEPHVRILAERLRSCLDASPAA